MVSPQKVKVPVFPKGQSVIIGLSRLARLKSFSCNQGDIFWKLQEKSPLSLAVEVIKRPRPRSPTRPMVRVGIGVGVGASIMVGEIKPPSLKFRRPRGDKRVLGEKIKYNRSRRMIETRKKITILTIMIASGLFLGACGIDKSGVEIVSENTAKVYLNGRESGNTPYKNNTLKPGEIDIKLVDNKGSSWERKVKLESNVTSVINWSFDENKDSGYILSMEKSGGNPSILVNSNPNGAMVYLDGELKTSSPAKIENIEEGDRKLSISYPGYKGVNLIVRAVSGYQLVVDVKLEKEVRENNINIISPVPTKSLGSRVKIKDTETGWLRVRDASSNNGSEIGKAKPGETYDLINEVNGWYQISYNGKEGWVSTKYAEKILE